MCVPVFVKRPVEMLWKLCVGLKKKQKSICEKYILKIPKIKKFEICAGRKKYCLFVILFVFSVAKQMQITSTHERKKERKSAIYNINNILIFMKSFIIKVLLNSISCMLNDKSSLQQKQSERSFLLSSVFCLFAASSNGRSFGWMCACVCVCVVLLRVLFHNSLLKILFICSLNLCGTSPYYVYSCFLRKFVSCRRSRLCFHHHHHNHRKFF